VKVEDSIGVDVLARDRLGPEFLHKEHLVGELRSGSHSFRRCGSSFANPVRQMTHKVEEEITVWNTYHCNSYTRIKFYLVLLGWVTVILRYNQQPRSTQPFISPQ